MATLMPASSNVEAAYEDMFKEITRKLYGEETGNGLHTLGTPVAQVATTGPTAAPEGERSFTNLQEIDSTSAPTIEYGQNTASVVTSVVTSTTSSKSQAQAAAAAVAAAHGAATGATNVIMHQSSSQAEGSASSGSSVIPQVSAAAAAAASFIKSEDEISSAFGLAALMHSGFPNNTNPILNNQAINKIVTNAAGQQQQQQQQQQLQQAVNITDQQRWGNDGNASASVNDQQQQHQPTQVVQWATTNGKMQSFNQQQQQQQQQHQQVITTPKSKSKNRNDQATPATNSAENLYTSPTSSGVINLNTSGNQQTTPTSVINTPNTSSSGGSTSSSGSSSGNRKKQQHTQQNANGGIPIVKRYACTHCPYSTDRRDLYTRHENIHKDEKPFQCYACLKQFNRADHVKKHFLRMHREMEYDINKTRRHVANSTASHHSGGRGNVTIPAATTVHLDDAFLESQRQPTSSSMSIAETIEAVAKAADEPLPQMKQEKNDDGSLVSGTNGSLALLKPKREKRFTCCYCPWSGADKWGLKRHLNTHTKPFVCVLCDYKAARSERLATHVLRVHNKRACNKCSFLADTQEEYQTHLNEVHLMKMDAISRNTASVAQDFHKAGGVQELKIPANHQLLFNNKLPSQWTTREAAALLHSLSNMNNNNNNNANNYNNNNNNNNHQGNNLTIAYQQQQQRSKYQSLYQQQQQQYNLQNGRKRQHSTGEDDENTPSSSASSIASIDGLSPIKMDFQNSSKNPGHPKQMVINVDNAEQRKAMTAFLNKNLILDEVNSSAVQAVSSSLQQNTKRSKIKEEIFNEDQENQKQLILTSPAYKTSNKSSRNPARNANSNNQSHRLDLYNRYENNNDKENNLIPTGLGASLPPPANFLTQMEYQNLNKIGSQFQNYVKDIINKYYAETPLMFPAMPTPTMTPQQSQQNFETPPQQQQQQYTHSTPTSTTNERKRLLSETEEYIEYLKNKEDITLTITPKISQNPVNTTNSQANAVVVPLPPNKISNGKTPSPLKRQQDLAFVKKTSPKKSFPAPQNSNNLANKPRKSLSQLATLLPLLADAASQQQYLAAPLDFSKKSEKKDSKEEEKKVLPMAFNEEPEKLPLEMEDKVISHSSLSLDSSNPSTDSSTLSTNSSIVTDKRSSRKQAQPKKIKTPPEIVMAMLRDKYLNRLVNKKPKCWICKNSQQVIFHYHSKGSLALHKIWKHNESPKSCKTCGKVFTQVQSLAIHSNRVHGKVLAKNSTTLPQALNP